MIPIQITIRQPGSSEGLKKARRRRSQRTAQCFDMSAILTATPTLANNETHFDRKQASSVVVNNQMRRWSHPPNQYTRSLPSLIYSPAPPSSNEGRCRDIWHTCEHQVGIVDQQVYVQNMNTNVEGEQQITDDVVSIGDSCDSIKYTKRRLSVG
jgi:hypothetical protein